MKQIFIVAILLLTLQLSAQKKVLDHVDFDIWNVIKSPTISNDGELVVYALEKGEKDNFLKIRTSDGQLLLHYPRGSQGKFSDDSKYAFFTIKAWKDSVSEMNRRKVKKDKMPKDTLAIFNLATSELIKIPNVRSYKIPEKWSGYVAYSLHDINADKKANKENDSIKKKIKSSKKVGAKTGYHLVVRNLSTQVEDTLKFVTNFVLAKETEKLAYITTGNTKKSPHSIKLLDMTTGDTQHVFESHYKTKYFQLALSDSGKNIAFVADRDSTKVQVRPNELYHWSKGSEIAIKYVDAMTAPLGYRVSSDGSIHFSKDESKMYFGLATPPIVKDTTLLKEEIVNVEVWTYDEPRLYTVQELQVKSDQKKSYLTAIHLDSKKLVQLGNTTYPTISLGGEGNASYALASNPAPYQLEGQWTAQRASDYAIVDVSNGDITPILTKISGPVRLSPTAKYAVGYNRLDSTIFAYNIADKKLVKLAQGKPFYNEMNDSPNFPNSYGGMGWTEEDKRMLVYDRYDIWEFNPDTAEKKRITNGRASKTSFRYVQLDPEERNLNTKTTWLLRTFNETTKDAGFYKFSYRRGNGQQLVSGPYNYGTPKKSRDASKMLFTRESFIEFPNLRIGDLDFKNVRTISNANPQQSEYNWGTAELVYWNSLDGKKLTGMLFKPENFDPDKKYPMIVNFYEKSSDRLHGHRAPSPGRSTINYSFYTSRGYIIFNPDVHYRIGYPGESALNCVIPGITSLIEKGFVDKDNIGVQGHSWGGYQIAYLVTKTDIFKAAESGAPVPNMISAYGGIRWWTGLSRQFQYEHTQSRIGGTPWEYPARYVENSPIFNIDKINTPLLIMHNDADGHVPWYQGIEFFVSLRRLGKPSWFLNYNDEPHWPLKLQNRKDFNIRMAQFFDHYLKGAPKPVWMVRGVPAIEKGINQGLELIDDN